MAGISIREWEGRGQDRRNPRNQDIFQSIQVHESSGQLRFCPISKEYIFFSCRFPDWKYSFPTVFQSSHIPARSTEYIFHTPYSKAHTVVVKKTVVWVVSRLPKISRSTFHRPLICPRLVLFHAHSSLMTGFSVQTVSVEASLTVPRLLHHLGTSHITLCGSAHPLCLAICFLTSLLVPSRQTHCKRPNCGPETDLWTVRLLTGSPGRKSSERSSAFLAVARP